MVLAKITNFKSGFADFIWLSVLDFLSIRPGSDQTYLNYTTCIMILKNDVRHDGKECLSWDHSWLKDCVYIAVKLKARVLVLILLHCDGNFSAQ